MRHKGQPLYQWFYLMPHRREHLSVVGVLMAEAMHLLAEPTVVVWFRLDKAVERVRHHAAAHHHHTDAAHARPLPVGRLKIYRRKVIHLPLFG